jgi:hypothetical protein
MNIISSILSKELLKDNDRLNIIWTPCDNNNFLNLINSFGHNLYSYENLYFGYVDPNLIICNNKMYSHQQIKRLSLNYHLPVLVIDHIQKDQSIDLDVALKTINNFPCSYKIATNENIYNSWGQSHDEIIHIKDSESQKWKEIIYTIAKRTFIL